MKFLTAIAFFLTLSVAQAEVGYVESYFSPSEDKHEKIVHLYLQNNCYQDIFVAIRSQNPNLVWETKGYMRLFPGQILATGDMINNIYYLNAYTADRRVRWEGPHRFEVYGRFVPALLVELPRGYGGNWTTVLYCR